MAAWVYEARFERPPPRFRDPHAGDLDRLAASDDALGAR
jgi:hypothetical protein